jgi:hypothetical protein
LQRGTISDSDVAQVHTDIGPDAERLSFEVAHCSLSVHAEDESLELNLLLEIDASDASKWLLLDLKQTGSAPSFRFLSNI